MEYRTFWHQYLRAHARPATRLVHYAGSLAALACLIAAAATLDWRWLIAAPLVGYACAWAAHAGLEGNTPQTFGHPIWSLFSDYRMLGLWLAGRLGPHLAAANKEGPGNAGALPLSGGNRRET
ncbi:MAG TPA: DUF962 domain-containing protein [Acetobacteraceae bacterium]|nr:DUF962 domain-containing protein [Acetobacteraceae bacterium]